MLEPHSILITSLCGLFAVTILGQMTLRGWRDWIALKRAELEQRHQDSAPSAVSRIEVADLKERIRKLEAIAAGVDL